MQAKMWITPDSEFGLVSLMIEDTETGAVVGHVLGPKEFDALQQATREAADRAESTDDHVQINLAEILDH
ncbi:hypothetical protein FHR81_004526 [Actinoalloteichus hoggarensis]|nr:MULTISPECIES: hypothetical protein [Actinoalloteichus]APU15006.1 hypothetical protein UA74_14750 [Actinoalloteichus fjordicus]APU21074.1 hypothetical protein UA75_15320 [Actinoalloteichus sp. GBA129-24]MBB5908348.1 hypothetical protein [Actinoalloteichus hymeniacidonis]MBB5923455.1 hypothetical protein [Actinoalloteichus hoggarensis]